MEFPRLLAREYNLGSIVSSIVTSNHNLCWYDYLQFTFFFQIRIMNPSLDFYHMFQYLVFFYLIFFPIKAKYLFQRYQILTHIKTFTANNTFVKCIKLFYLSQLDFSKAFVHVPLCRIVQCTHCTRILCDNFIQKKILWSQGVLLKPFNFLIFWPINYFDFSI